MKGQMTTKSQSANSLNQPYGRLRPILKQGSGPQITATNSECNDYRTMFDLYHIYRKTYRNKRVETRSKIGTFGSGDKVPLELAYPIYILPVTFAIVRHNLAIEIEHGSTVEIVRAPGVFLNYHLIVDQGPVEDGEIETAVFNLSNKPMRIPKKEVISWLKMR